MTGAKPKCGATNRQGGACQQPAGFGTDHVGHGRCKWHGGSTTAGRKHAAEAAAREAMVTYGRPVDTTGVEALLDELKWTAGHVVYLRGRIQRLAPEALTWGVSKVKGEGSVVLKVTEGADGLDDVDVTAVPTVNVERVETAGIAAEVKLYLEERRHLVDVAEACVRVGIEERRIRLAEDQGALLVHGIRWLGEQLKLTTRQLARFEQAVPAMLRALDAGELPPLEPGDPS